MNIVKRRLTTFKIYRNNTGKTRLDKFLFDKEIAGPMVLDGLIHIKNHIDGTLGFRRSCR